MLYGYTSPIMMLKVFVLVVIGYHVSAQNNDGSGPLLSNIVTLEKARAQLLYPFDESDLKQINQVKPLRDEILPFRLPFFGFGYRYIWVHKDGCFKFNRGLPEGNDERIVFPVTKEPQEGEDPSLICPWFARQDIPSSVKGAGVYFRVINVGKLDLNNNEEKILRDRILLDFSEGMVGASNFHPKYVLIATWKNVTFINRRSDDNPKTNTYQAVIATDEKTTYVMFNYDWITWITSQDNYEGMKGLSAFVGFNAGNRTRSYEYIPHSQGQRITRLQKSGLGNDLEGRHFFQIDEEIWPGSCIENELDISWNTRPRLTFFPKYGSMLGGTIVNMTGPCFTNKNSVIRCKFDTIETVGVWQSVNHISCVSPPVMYNGYVDLSVSIDHGPYLFQGKYYIQPPDIVEADVTVQDGKDRQEAPDELVLNWNSHKLTWNTRAPVTLSLWGYREQKNSRPSLTYIDVLKEGEITNGQGPLGLSLALEPLRQRLNSGKSNIKFGFIAINLTNPEPSFPSGAKISPVLWSGPMPLAWYFQKQYVERYGDTWKDDICLDWWHQEYHSNRFASALSPCPCTLDQAKLDRGRFAPDLECNEIDRKCETFYKAAYHCMRSGRPAANGAGQLCCYDDKGELMRTKDTMYAGRPARAFQFGKHPFKQNLTVPTLSHWEHDVAPFFFCCKWAEEDMTDSCDMYQYWRSSQDCSTYKPPGIASAFGDPHFVTFDRVKYTFNGKGEFVLARVNNTQHKLDVQGRFEQPKNPGGPAINATKLMAVVARENLSSTVEFRVRPGAASWRYQMYIIVDKEYIYFWDNNLRIQYFKGVTLYQTATTYNMSHVIAMFDSGAGVEVKVEEGNMAVHVFLPLTHKNATAGLLGNWSGVQDDDFTSPDGEVRYPPNAATNVLHRFGNEWRLRETENKQIGKSLFFHDAIPYSEYNDENFVPHFEVPRIPPEKLPFTKETVNSVCGNSLTCKFDALVTADLGYSRATRNHETYAQKLASGVRNEGN